MSFEYGYAHVLKRPLSGFLPPTRVPSRRSVVRGSHGPDRVATTQLGTNGWIYPTWQPEYVVVSRSKRLDVVAPQIGRIVAVIGSSLF